MGTRIRAVLKYSIVYCLCIVSFILLLLLGCCLPQSPIEQHLKESIPVLESEGNYPMVSEEVRTTRLDNHTEALILMESVSMNLAHPGFILTNPLYVDGTAVDALRPFSESREEPTDYYVRYWQGFRFPVRLLLTFFSYSGIRTVLAVAFFGFALACFVIISRRLDLRSGFLFALSIALINPHVVCRSLDYSCCFLLAFAAILMMPFIIQTRKEYVFFFILGMVTMFFDFYTVPLITLGYPLIFSLLLKTKEKPLWKESFFPLFIWLAGYALSWIAKLGLTTVFTPVNGFADGFRSFAERVGLAGNGNGAKAVGVADAFDNLWEVLFPETINWVVFFIVIGYMMLSVMVLLLLHKNHKGNARRYISLLLPLSYVLLWFVATSGPIYFHSYFQYRSIAVLIWSGCMYYSLLFFPIRGRKRMESTAMCNS